MAIATTNGHELLSLGRRCLASDSIPVVVVATPAGGRAVPTECASVPGTTANGGERLVLRGRSLTAAARTPADRTTVFIEATGEDSTDAYCYQILYPGRTYAWRVCVTPTDRRSVLAKTAGMTTAAADGCEPLALRRPGLPVVVVSPTDGGAVLAEPAGMLFTAAESSKLFALGRRCLAVLVIAPTEWFAILSKRTRVISSAADGHKPVVGLRRSSWRNCGGWRIRWRRCDRHHWPRRSRWGCRRRVTRCWDARGCWSCSVGRYRLRSYRGCLSASRRCCELWTGSRLRLSVVARNSGHHQDDQQSADDAESLSSCSLSQSKPPPRAIRCRHSTELCAPIPANSLIPNTLPQSIMLLCRRIVKWEILRLSSGFIGFSIPISQSTPKTAALVGSRPEPSWTWYNLTFPHGSGSVLTRIHPVLTVLARVL